MHPPAPPVTISAKILCAGGLRVDVDVARVCTIGVQRHPDGLVLTMDGTQGADEILIPLTAVAEALDRVVPGASQIVIARINADIDQVNKSVESETKRDPTRCTEPGVKELCGPGLTKLREAVDLGLTTKQSQGNVVFGPKIVAYLLHLIDTK